MTKIKKFLISQIDRSLVVKARFLYIGLPLLAIIVLLVIGSVISASIADDFAKRLARQYSIEAASNFQASTSPHFVLMHQISRSQTIARWLAYEDDEHYKYRAFHEISHFASFAPDTRIMFTAERTRNGYDFSHTMSIEDFEPWGQLAGGDVSQWYYNTRDAEIPFIINIQRERPELTEEEITLFVWSNHRIYFNGEFVGVMTVGSPFDAVFYYVFGSFDVDSKRGFIIDENGYVRADSSRMLTLHEMGLPTLVPVPESYCNPELCVAIDTHLALRQNGIFQPGNYNLESFQLSNSVYRYASISPIIGTNWSIIVLSTHQGIFSGRYMPMILASTMVVIVSMLLGGVIVQKWAINPLLRLSQNVTATASDVYNQEDLYGLGFRNEIGDVARAVQLMRDNLKHAMTEMQRIEIAEESAKAKSLFLARMSHDLRTPISAVLSISEIQLQDTTLPIQTEEAFAKIHNSANLLLSIINDLLDFSKIESGKMSLRSEKYEICSMIGDVVSLHLPYVDDKNISFRIHVDEKLPVWLVGDALRIVQILNNLLSNAFKYTESGAVEVTVRGESRDDDTIMLVLSVSDSGYGMTAAQVGALRDEYIRFHEQQHRFISGTGLGMSIVYHLADMMGASVDIESEVGKGTIMTVSVPQTVVGDDVLGKDTANKLENFEPTLRTVVKKFDFEPEQMPYGHVLVVDDIQTNLYVAERMLGFYGIKVETCASGREAIEKITTGAEYDIIFLDYMMPEMDGVETLQALRAMGYTGTIVALTANALIGEAEKLMELGFDGFMAKPIEIKLLNATLIKHIKSKHPQDVIDEAVQKSRTEDMYAMQNELKAQFLNNHSGMYTDLTNEIAKDDLKAARITAHSIKGIAGLILEVNLVKAARAVEKFLESEVLPADETMKVLQAEFDRVVSSIKSTTAQNNEQTHGMHLAHEQSPAQKIMAKASALELLDILIPLLKSCSVESLDYVNELEKIPQAGIIALQISKFKFTSAYENALLLQELLKK